MNADQAAAEVSHTRGTYVPCGCLWLPYRYGHGRSIRPLPSAGHPSQQQCLRARSEPSVNTGPHAENLALVIGGARFNE